MELDVTIVKDILDFFLYIPWGVNYNIIHQNMSFLKPCPLKFKNKHILKSDVSIRRVLFSESVSFTLSDVSIKYFAYEYISAN